MTTTDAAIDLLRDGYRFGQRHRTGPDGAFRTAVPLRLLGRQALLVGGPQGARLFYDTRRMSRVRSVPLPVRAVLFGPGAVHGTDDPVHGPRKDLLLRATTPASVDGLLARTRRLWDDALARWTSAGGAPDLLDEAVRVLGVGVCDWAGIRLTPADAPRRVGDLFAMVDGFAGVGPRMASAAAARVRAQSWARGLVRDVRAGRLDPPAGSALAVLARSEEPRLSDSVAATELLNVVRPTVAVAYFVAWAGHALHTHPDLRGPVAAGDRPLTRAFVHELRRWYPFVPVLAARAREDVELDGERLPAGRLVVLDVRGTLHDPALYDAPEVFDPRRFLGVEPDPFTFLPQGGGDPRSGHRCAGEQVTIRLLEQAAGVLARAPFDSQPPRGAVPLRRMPARPGGPLRVVPRAPAHHASPTARGVGVKDATHTEVPVMERSTTHGPRVDDEMAHETRGLVQGGHGTHAEEWRDPEPAGEDQPTGDQGIVPEDRRCTPPGMTSDDVELRSEIARHLGKDAYPGDRDALLAKAEENSAPDAVLGRLRSLPAGEEFRNVQDVARALGLHVETARS